MTRLQQLFDEQKQSPWLDNLRRGWVTDGELQRWVDRGVRGITSNPSIFQKAIEGATDYDEQFGSLVAGGSDVTDAYWDLVTTDIRSALSILRPVYDASDGLDGYVSVEVVPGPGPRHRGHARLGPSPPRPSSPSPTSTSRSPAPPRACRPSAR